MRVWNIELSAQKFVHEIVTEEGSKHAPKLFQDVWCKNDICIEEKGNKARNVIMTH